MFTSFILPMIFLICMLIVFFLRIDIAYAFSMHAFHVQQRIKIKVLVFSKTLDIEPKQRDGQAPGLSELKEYRKIVKRAVENMDVPDFELSMTIGLGDAFMTAMVCGAAQTAGSMALFYLLPRNKLHLQKQVNIQPDFDRECLDMDLHCILLTNIANIIGVIIQIIISRRSGKIASNRKHDEDHNGRNTRDD